MCVCVCVCARARARVCVCVCDNVFISVSMIVCMCDSLYVIVSFIDYYYVINFSVDRYDRYLLFDCCSICFNFFSTSIFWRMLQLNYKVTAIDKNTLNANKLKL